MKLYKFSTKVIIGDSCRKQLFEGVKILNQATSVTLGPTGNNVVIESEIGLPRITKDGVTVAKNVKLYDKNAELSAYIMRTGSGQTNDYGGDAATLIQESFKYLQIGSNPVLMKRGIDKAKNEVLQYLDQISEPIKDVQQIFDVAMIATNSDVQLSQVITEAIEQVQDGVIEIDQSLMVPETFMNIYEGILLNRGYQDTGFRNNQKEYNIEYQNCYVLIVNLELKSIEQIVPLLDKVAETKKQLIILCEHANQQVTKYLAQRNKMGVQELCVITCPGFDDFTIQTLQDINILVDSYIITPFSDKNLENIEVSDIGTCQKVIVNPYETQFLSPAKQMVEDKVEDLQDELKYQDKRIKRGLTKNRIARLRNKQAVIYVGGTNDIERLFNRDKIIDALNSCQFAFKHGILPGGGISLLRASLLLNYFKLESEDENYGVKCFQIALQQVTKKILQNNYCSFGIIQEKVFESDDIFYGYDCKNKQFGNLKDLGIIDSLQIVKNSVIDGVSTGGMIITTEASVVKLKRYTPPKLNTYKRDIF